MRTTLVLTSLILIAPATAQTALLREADPSPDGTAGQTIDSIGTPAVNQLGGYACSIDTEGTNGDVWQFWGDLAGGPGALLREEQTVGPLEQTLFETRFGLAASAIAYSGSATDTVSGTAGLEAVWLDDTLLMLEGDPVVGTADFWVFAQNTGVTSGGEPYFRGGISLSAGGATDRRGVFYGTPLTALYLTGDLLTNMPFELSDVAVDADFRFSSNGSHSIVPVDLESGSTADDGAMAIDQVGLMLGGTLVREGETIPTSIGGTGDAWDNFDYCGITEAGDYIFTGDTDGDSQSDEFIVRDGTIWAREGQMLGGEMLSGSLEGASINEFGDIAFVWGIDTGPGTPDEALYFEDQILLREGDAVDWDGDGAIDPAITIQSFTGTNTITLARDGSIYFTADVDVSGTTLEGFFVIEGPTIGTSYCMANANSTGVAAGMSGTGSAVAADNMATLMCSSMPVNSFAFMITSQVQGFVMNPAGSAGNLCLSGAIGRFVGPGQIQNSGTLGEVSLTLDLTQQPTPTGFVAVQAGETWNFSTWFRDSGPAGPTSNFSDGYTVLFL